VGRLRPACQRLGHSQRWGRKGGDLCACRAGRHRPGGGVDQVVGVNLEGRGAWLAPGRLHGLSKPKRAGGRRTAGQGRPVPAQGRAGRSVKRRLDGISPMTVREGKRPPARRGRAGERLGFQHGDGVLRRRHRRRPRNRRRTEETFRNWRNSRQGGGRGSGTRCGGRDRYRYVTGQANIAAPWRRGDGARPPERFIGMSSACVEYVCEGCGSPFLLLGINQRPAHGFCIICAVLSEHVPDPAELVELRGAIARDLAAD
jgi:hypothetical protein